MLSDPGCFGAQEEHVRRGQIESSALQNSLLIFLVESNIWMHPQLTSVLFCERFQIIKDPHFLQSSMEGQSSMSRSCGCDKES